MNFDPVTGLQVDGTPVPVADHHEAVTTALVHGTPVYCQIAGGGFFKAYPSGAGKMVLPKQIPGLAKPLTESQVTQAIASGQLDGSLALIQTTVTTRLKEI